MNKKDYEKISEPFRKHRQSLLFLNKTCTLIGYLSYPILLLVTYFTKQELLLQIIAIPGSGFILLTWIRKLINKKRPYEVLDINPIIKKDTQGKSMPSRHVFSMAIIALSWLLVNEIIGVLLLLCAVLLAAIRVIGGVHYLSDVIVGYISAVLWSCIYLI